MSWKYDNDPVSTKNGYSDSGFKRCVDVGWKVKYNIDNKIYTVTNINHEGYPDVQKIKLDTPKGQPSWVLVSSVEIFPRETHPEYYL